MFSLGWLAGLVVAITGLLGGSQTTPPIPPPTAAIVEQQATSKQQVSPPNPFNVEVADTPAPATKESSHGEPGPTRSAQPTVQPQQATLSNDNYYTNVDGNTVHSPAYSSDSCEAVGASAECRDGTCSFSQHRSGTCSHHGGVARWIY